MRPRTFILAFENIYIGKVITRVHEAIDEIAKELEDGDRIEITMHDYDPPRTLQQNAYYWSAMVGPLSKHFGYTVEEMHEALLGEKFGIRHIGHLSVPNKRSSKLTKSEMTEYLQWVPQFAAENGVVLGLLDGS